MYDLGIVLLEEGHTWEADECLSQANTVFRKTRKSDTPHNLDELTWGLMGVARGQDMWGRYSTMVRTQDKTCLKAVNEWKCTRKMFPIASMPQKWYKTQNRAEFDRQYESVMPKKVVNLKKASSVKIRHTSFFVHESDADQSRRLFEFTPKEMESRTSMWYIHKGFDNMFGFINASDKPRVVPKHIDDEPEKEKGDSEDNLNMTMSEIKLRAQQDSQTTDLFTQRRKTEASRRATHMALSLRKSRTADKSITMTGKSVSDWLKHDFRQKAMQRRSTQMGRLKKMTDPNLSMGDRLTALLDDMQDITNLDEGDDGIVVHFEVDDKTDDESDDTELASAATRKSRMDSETRKEFLEFDDKKLGF